MTRKFSFLIFLLFIVSPLYSGDPVETLIEDEQKATEEEDHDESLPAVFLWGDVKAVQVYSPVLSLGKGNLLCEPIELDELIELSRGNAQESENVLNLSLPRVRDAVYNACLIRSNDTFVAVGEGWQTKIHVKNFLVRRERVFCASDSPFSLWMSFDKPLPGQPLFFSTDEELQEGHNDYQQFTEVVVSSPSILKRIGLNQYVGDIRDYVVTNIELNATNAFNLFVLRRKSLSIEDNQLPNELIISSIGDQMEKVWVERVDSRQGSGHLKVEGSFDFNRDGLRDLVVSGDHNGCSYQLILQGQIQGFSPLDLPLKSCGC